MGMNGGWDDEVQNTNVRSQEAAQRCTRAQASRKSDAPWPSVADRDHTVVILIGTEQCIRHL